MRATDAGRMIVSSGPATERRGRAGRGSTHAARAASNTSEFTSGHHAENFSATLAEAANFR
jgi:hypothetical protein